MKPTIEEERIVYSLKMYLRKSIDNCSTTECKSALSLINDQIIYTLDKLGFEDKSCIDLFFNKEDK